MNEPRPTPSPETTRRELARRRRAKRGLVASYIRELSARSAGRAAAPARQEQPQGG